MSQSGDAAVAAAQARAESTRELNIESVPPLPIASDTANVRLGPELDDANLALLPLIGIWRGYGRFGNDPGERAPQFGQQITFAHDGRDVVRYESVTWLLDPDGAITGPGPREIGWLRTIAPDTTGTVGEEPPAPALRFTVAHADGGVDVFAGLATAITRWEFAGARASRLYGVTPDGKLAYVDERIPAASLEASAPEPEPYASAALERIAG